MARAFGLSILFVPLAHDAMAVYLRDPAFAAFPARWCVPVASGIGEGFLRIREDEPAQTHETAQDAIAGG
jgi:hypothetical protein